MNERRQILHVIFIFYFEIENGTQVYIKRYVDSQTIRKVSPGIFLKFSLREYMAIHRVNFIRMRVSKKIVMDLLFILYVTSSKEIPVYPINLAHGCHMPLGMQTLL